MIFQASRERKSLGMRMRGGVKNAMVVMRHPAEEVEPDRIE